MNALLGPEVGRVVERALREHGVPGMVVAAARDGGSVEHLCRGSDAAGRELSADTLFPVASVTKMATGLAVLRLVDAGRLGVDDPVERHLPEARIAREGVTLRDLLRHTSGLPFFYDEDALPYSERIDWPAVARVSLATPPQWAPRSRVQYSNVGYALLAVTVERICGERFASALRRLVLDPLRLEAYLGVEPPRPVARIADVNRPGSGTVLEQFNSAFWRSLASPSGGLITTARGALALVGAFRGLAPGFLRPETLAEATRDQTFGLAGGSEDPFIWPHCPWGLGVELRGAKEPHWAPPTASRASLGHMGYTGAVAWADPAAGVAWAFLGARTVDSLWVIHAGPVIGAAILAATPG